MQLDVPTFIALIVIIFTSAVWAITKILTPRAQLAQMAAVEAAANAKARWLEEQKAKEKEIAKAASEEAAASKAKKAKKAG